jgi:outer membrane protein insertion porin family
LLQKVAKEMMRNIGKNKKTRFMINLPDDKMMYLSFDDKRVSSYRTNPARVKPGWRCVLGIMTLVSMMWILAWTPPSLAQNMSNGDRARNPFINEIAIEGNQAFDDKQLKRQMHTKEPSFFAIFKKPRLKHDYLRRDVGALEAFYHARGFFEAKVRLKDLAYSQDGRFVDIIIEVDEGKATRVSEVDFRGNRILYIADLRRGLMLYPGVPFNPSLLDSDIYRLKTKYFDRGYLDVAIEDSVSISDYNAGIVYKIDPGPVFDIDQIEVRGNKLTKKSIIESELTFKTGDVFKLSKLLQAQRNLYETGLFTEVDMIPEHLDTTAKLVDIGVRVRERKSAYIEAGFGVGNVLGSRVLAEWGDRNLFGTGRTLRLKSEYSFGIFENNDLKLGKFKVKTRFYRYEGEFHQRRFWGKKLLLSLNSFYEKDATVEPITVRTIGVTLGSRRRLARYTELLLRLSHERIKTEFLDEPDVKSTTRMLTTNIIYDKRDFILNPKRGVYRSLQLQFAGGPLAGDNDFYTISSSMQQYMQRLGTVFAVRLRVGFADAFGDSKNSGVPIEKRYFAGGGNSVRGYPEASLGPVTDPLSAPSVFQGGTVIGGRVLMLTNAEMRFPLPYLSKLRLSGVMFIDGGNVWSSLKSVRMRNFRMFADEDEVVQQDYRYSIGLGIRYNTPVGPIRLDYGIPIKREPGMGETGRFHISLGQIF